MKLQYILSVPATSTAAITLPFGGGSSQNERKRVHANYWNRTNFKCRNQSVYFY